MVVKSTENRQADQICFFCCYLLWSGSEEADVKFRAYAKLRLLFNVLENFTY